MKKILLFAFFILAFLGTRAANQVTFSTGDKLNVEDAGFVAVCDKNVCLVQINDFYRPTHFDLFDGNLNIVHSFDIPVTLYGEGRVAEIHINGDVEYDSNNAEAAVILTQYLFNDDDLYEFLIEEGGSSSSDKEFKIL